MSAVELMIVSRIVTTHKDHLSAHVVMDLHLMEMERHVLVSHVVMIVFIIMLLLLINF